MRRTSNDDLSSSIIGCTPNDIKSIFSNSKSKNIFDDPFLVEKRDIILTSLKEDRFVLEYQPKVSIEPNSVGEVTGLEALVRLKIEDELISPYFFIEFCERSKLIVDLGDYLFEQAARDMKMWKEGGAKLVPCSINVTREQLVSRNRAALGTNSNPNYSSYTSDMTTSSTLLDHIEKISEKYGVPREMFELELIERDTAGSIDERISFEEILPILYQIKQRGHKLSIDDYGNGSHNINTLKSNVFDYLKIDREQTSQIPVHLMSHNTVWDPRIFNDFLHYSSNYNLKTVVEGVESKEQLDFLRVLEFNNRRFNSIQGYYISKPLPSDKIPSILIPEYFKDKF